VVVAPAPARRDERSELELAAATALLADAIEFLPAFLGLSAITPMSANRSVEVCLSFADSLSALVNPVSLGRNHAQQERAQECCLTDSTEPLIAGHRFILERRGILHQGHRAAWEFMLNMARRALIEVSSLRRHCRRVIGPKKQKTRGRHPEAET
jgi:hypothetical protein